MYLQLELFFKKVCWRYVTKNFSFEMTDVITILGDLCITFLKIVAPILAIIFVIAISVQLAQVGFLFSIEAIGMKFEKINPFEWVEKIIFNKFNI